MSKLIEKDISIKVISVLFAILLWIYVINFNNPIETKVISVPLRYVNEDALTQKGISLKTRDYQDVVVTVRGRKIQLKKIDESSFQPAILDLSQVARAENKMVPIKEPKFIGNENIKIISVSPQVKKLDLEKIGKRSVKVQVIREGSLKENYKVIDVRVVPENITVQGYESVVGLVASLKSTVRYQNLDRDISYKRVPCKAINKDGMEVLGVAGDLFVDVTVKVAKEVPVVPTVKGKPAENFMEGMHFANPNRVLITGDPAVLAGIDYLGTETIDLTQTNKAFTTDKNIILPSGVKLHNTAKNVKVSISVEPLSERKITLNSEEIAIINADAGSELVYSVLTPRLTILVKGEREYLDKLTLGSLKPSVDVAGLGRGLHTVPLKVNLTGISKLDQKYNVEISIEYNASE